MTENRPTPEALLKIVKLEEKKSKAGKLKIFFGMSAGVGKTYAMLEDAQQRKEEGIDIVIGIVNTHGRKETDALTVNLSKIPEKSINYKGSVFTELDIDAVLKRRPQIVIIDELAHTNIPGSRHPKRWQDVLEILDAGIDVYTTLNVQHVESRKDLVEEITGIQVRETVPDSILEMASQIELVDITPSELLKRLKEGKVYLGPQSEIAAKNFFQEDRLTALREIALRITAEKVDHDLHNLPNIEKTGLWRTSERLLVAVSASPSSQRLIRTTRRYAFVLDAPWIALHVDTGRRLSDKDNEQLSKNLSLARELGAEVITASDTDIGKAMQRIARQKNVTQIILGRSPKKHFFKNLFGLSLVDLLNKESIDVDIHLIRQDTESIPSSQATKLRQMEFTSPPRDYWWTAFFTLAIGGICDLISPYIGYPVVGFIFIFSIILFSLFVSRGPLLLSALLFSIIWGFFSPAGRNPFNIQDIILFITFFGIAFVLSILTDRIKRRESLLLRYEEKTMILYEIVREIATAPFSKELFTSICDRLDRLLNGKSEIFLKEANNELSIPPETELLKDEKEKAVAKWVLENGKKAGWSTDTLSSVKNLYIPLKSSKEIVGVLTFQPIPPRSLQLEEINLLQTICQEVANYIERTIREEKDRKAEYMHQVEKLQHTILNSISHEFSNPLSSIKGAARELKNPELTKNVALHTRKIQQIEDSSNTLSWVIDNVLAMSRLSSGFLKVKKETHHIRSLIDACLINLKKNLGKHVIKIEVEDNLPQIYFDFALMELLLCNLLINAVEYSPEGKTIFIISKAADESVLLSVADEGKGIPADSIHLVFQKFYRVPGTEPSGMGLGLAIVKTIADLHDAKIEIQNRPEGGLEITLYFPKQS